MIRIENYYNILSSTFLPVCILSNVSPKIVNDLTEGLFFLKKRFLKNNNFLKQYIYFRITKIK